MTNDNAASGPEAPASELPPAERTGPAIISLLQQAADAARRNEERAKAYAEQLAQELRALAARNEQLEAQARDYYERATRAEEWLMHIYDEIHVKLIEASPSITADGAPPPAVEPIRPAARTRAKA